MDQFDPEQPAKLIGDTMYNYIVPTKENNLKAQYDEYRAAAAVLEEDPAFFQDPLPTMEVMEDNIEVNLQKMSDKYNLYKSDTIQIKLPTEYEVRNVSRRNIFEAKSVQIIHKRLASAKAMIDINISSTHNQIASQLSQLNKTLEKLTIAKKILKIECKMNTRSLTVWKDKSKQNANSNTPIDEHTTVPTKSILQRYIAAKISSNSSYCSQRYNLELTNQMKVLSQSMLDKDKEIDRLSNKSSHETTDINTSSFHMNVGNLMMGDTQNIAQLKKANAEMKEYIKKMRERNELQKKAFQRELKKFIETYEIMVMVC